MKCMPSALNHTLTPDSAKSGSGSTIVNEEAAQDPHGALGDPWEDGVFHLNLRLPHPKSGSKGHSNGPDLRKECLVEAIHVAVAL